MRKTMVRVVAVGLVVAAAWARQAWAADPYDTLVAGKAAFEKTCALCHSLDKPNSKTPDAEGWGKIIDRMKSNGAAFDAQGRELILAWLEAKSTFETKCSLCHGTDQSLGKSKSRAEWKATVEKMGAKKPGHLSDAEVETISAYLAILRPAP